MTTRHIPRLALLALLLTACATTPKFDTAGINLGVTPQQATAESKTLQGARVLWGGVIIASNNLKEATQFEILAYPLDDDQRPELDKAPLGRFIAEQEGFLETTNYKQGRSITVTGTLQENRKGRVGETEYTYPVLKIDNHYLWPIRRGSPDTQFHFGVGVIFRN